ncbi:hypothetical protein GOV06_04605, partial [Candidatus Woesearchaeota archaeon]|nr:hypothetical protein [Candidatus Woesearchaeota archaeon]
MVKDYYRQTKQRYKRSKRQRERSKPETDTSNWVVLTLIGFLVLLNYAKNLDFDKIMMQFKAVIILLVPFVCIILVLVCFRSNLFG